MKRFVFRLETVLEMRVRAEQRAQAALGLAQKQVTDAERYRISLETRRMDALIASATATFDQRVAAVQWAESLSEKIRHVGFHLQTLEMEAEARRRELAKAASDRRAVEKLRERARAEYEAEAQRVEQNQLDEVGSARYEFARRQGAQAG